MSRNGFCLSSSSVGNFFQHTWGNLKKWPSNTIRDSFWTVIKFTRRKTFHFAKYTFCCSFLQAEDFSSVRLARGEVSWLETYIVLSSSPLECNNVGFRTNFRIFWETL